MRVERHSREPSGGSMLLLLHLMLLALALGESDVQLPLPKDGLYNPSLVMYNGRLVITARETLSPRAANLHGTEVQQYFNYVHICLAPTLEAVKQASCQTWDPWTLFHECDWGRSVYKHLGHKAYTGVDDTKLFVWPGKGLYAITGRHQEVPHNASDPFCKQFIWRQYLALVVPETQPGDAWHIARPVQMSIENEAAVYKGRHFVFEKNWMPFIYNNELYITYYLCPRHIVYRYVSPMQPLELVHTTHSKLLADRFDRQKVHGGPPVIYIPANASSSGRAYYLGVLHAKRSENGQVLMPHHAYKMDDQPPFRIMAVSKELPLKTVEGKQPFIFASGLWLDAAANNVLISYGASDAAARLFSTHLHELESRFFE